MTVGEYKQIIQGLMILSKKIIFDACLGSWFYWKKRVGSQHILKSALMNEMLSQDRYEGLFNEELRNIGLKFGKANKEENKKMKELLKAQQALLPPKAKPNRRSPG